MKVVGTDSLNYNQVRNFAGLEIPGFQFKKVRDMYKIMNHTYFRIKGKPHPYYHYFFNDPGINRTDLYHFFNTVYLGKKPWLVTFESELPRHNHTNLKGIEALAKDNCLALIAFCERAKLVQQARLAETGSSLTTTIINKTIVLQPGQKLHIARYDDKELPEKFTFTFTGVDFFRKGGFEILLAAEKLLEQGYEFSLNLISKIKTGGWKDQHITDRDKQEVQRILDKYKDSILLIESMSNKDVLSTFKKSHVALLPSYGETYGYVVLEAQACGTPVITTKMPPFEEFNDATKGWLCEVPLIKRNGIFDSNVYAIEQALEFRFVLTEGVYKAMKEALENRTLVTDKGKQCLEHIRKNHDPQTRIYTLQRIYSKA